MSLRRLSVTDFRNHADALIVPDRQFVLLTGENGAGKTNILEAISILAPGRGLRGVPLRDMARQKGPGNFSIAAQLEDVTIGTGTTADAPDRRVVRINGAQAAATALSEWLSIIWLTPAMDRLFIESPGGRRRFLDRLVLALHPGHAVHSARYEAAMRSRTKLLTADRPADHRRHRAGQHRHHQRDVDVDATLGRDHLELLNLRSESWSWPADAGSG